MYGAFSLQCLLSFPKIRVLLVLLSLLVIRVFRLFPVFLRLLSVQSDRVFQYRVFRRLLSLRGYRRHQMVLVVLSIPVYRVRLFVLFRTPIQVHLWVPVTVHTQR